MFAFISAFYRSAVEFFFPLRHANVRTQTQWTPEKRIIDITPSARLLPLGNSLVTERYIKPIENLSKSAVTQKVYRTGNSAKSKHRYNDFLSMHPIHFQKF